MSAGKQQKIWHDIPQQSQNQLWKNDSSRRVNPQPVISFPGRQQILSSFLYRGTPAKSGIIWFYCFLSNNSPSLRRGDGFVLIKWPFCSLRVVRKGQTGRKWMRSVAFCWWKLGFIHPQLWASPETTVWWSLLSLGICHSQSSWKPRGVFVFPVFLLFGAAAAPSHCQFSYRCSQLFCSSCETIPLLEITPILSKPNVFPPKAEGIMMCWNIQALLFRLIYPKSFKFCKVPARTSEVLFLIPLMGFISFGQLFHLH